MFKWYRNAFVCLAYLADVSNFSIDIRRLPPRVMGPQFHGSEWFKRGWTLQELIAPGLVVFLSKKWKIIGGKGNGKGNMKTSLPAIEQQISDITGIPVDALVDPAATQSMLAELKLKWAKGRRTDREEDIWYCLFGLLDAPIGANYGEGAERAMKRLLRELEDSGAIESGRASAVALEMALIQLSWQGRDDMLHNLTIMSVG